MGGYFRKELCLRFWGFIYIDKYIFWGDFFFARVGGTLKLYLASTSTVKAGEILNFVVQTK